MTNIIDYYENPNPRLNKTTAYTREEIYQTVRDAEAAAREYEEAERKAGELVWGQDFIIGFKSDIHAELADLMASTEIIHGHRRIELGKNDNELFPVKTWKRQIAKTRKTTKRILDFIAQFDA